METRGNQKMYGSSIISGLLVHVVANIRTKLGNSGQASNVPSTDQWVSRRKESK